MLAVLYFMLLCTRQEEDPDLEYSYLVDTGHVLVEIQTGSKISVPSVDVVVFISFCANSVTFLLCFRRCPRKYPNDAHSPTASAKDYQLGRGGGTSSGNATSAVFRSEHGRYRVVLVP